MTTDSQKLELLNYWLSKIPDNYLKLPPNSSFNQNDLRNVLIELRPGSRSPSDLFALRDRIEARVSRRIPRMTEQNPLLVFVSYSYTDRNIAAIIKQALIPTYEVFVAHEDNQISEFWEQKIEENIQSMKFFIPILSENYGQSVWANQEAGVAFLRRLRDEIFIIPIRINDTPVHEPAFLRRIQGINCSTQTLDSLGPQIRRQIEQLG